MLLRIAVTEGDRKNMHRQKKRDLVKQHRARNALHSDCHSSVTAIKMAGK